MNESDSITFSLKLLRNSIANFIVAGSSLALFFGTIVGVVITALVEGIGINTTSTFDLFLIFILGPAMVLAVIAYLRLIRDFRQKVTFSPSGITLRVQKSKQTLSWDQIRHIEMLPDLFAVQFPTTAVVFRATSPQREQFLALVREPPSRFLTNDPYRGTDSARYSRRTICWHANDCGWWHRDRGCDDVLVGMGSRTSSSQPYLFHVSYWVYSMGNDS